MQTLPLTFTLGSHVNHLYLECAESNPIHSMWYWKINLFSTHLYHEWGYTYGPPMAVAPIPSVRRVLEYAVTEIPPEKISMGIPNYGYDWPLPFVRGETAARSIGNQEAVAIAAANNAVIQYDETSQAPFFEYTSQGTQHIVWFEDVRSILAKFRLVKEFGFPRVDYWQLMRPFRQNWLLLCTEFSLSEPF